MDSREKLTTLADELMPRLEELIPGGRVVTAFLRPQLEERLARELDRAPDELDAWLGRLIDFAARLRSDDAPAFAGDAAGCYELVNRGVHGEPSALDCIAGELGDPLQRPDLRDGDDRLGQEHART